MSVGGMTPADLMELGFLGSYEAHRPLHSEWRRVLLAIQDMCGASTAHDAGDNDVYFDLLLRQLEDEQREQIRVTGLCHPHSRTRFQIQLTRYWLVSMGEMIRSARKLTPVGSPQRELLTKYTELFGSVRMMISKREIQTANQAHLPILVPNAYLIGKGDGNYEISGERNVDPKKPYQVRPIMSTNGSICFPVYDAVSDTLLGHNRRDLSDMMLHQVWL